MRIKESLRTVWEIYKRDVKALVKNPVALIIAIGVIFLPSVYAWATIAADWDPYGRTQYLKVGFVNLDEGAEMNETQLNLGRQVEDELRKNRDLGWQFVDEKQAMTGVESGEYYAAIVIPQDFSRDFLSVLSGEYQRPKIQYYVNEKISATAPEFTNSGANAVENEVNAQFTGTVSRAMVEIIQKAGVLVQDKTEAAEGSLAASVAEAKDEIATATATIDGYQGSIGEMREAITEVRGVIESLKAMLPGKSAAILDAQGRVEELRTGVSELDRGVANLAEKLNGLEEALDEKYAAELGQTEQGRELLDILKNIGGKLGAIEAKLGLMSANSIGAMNSFAGALGTLNGVVLELAPILTAVEGGLDQMDATLSLANEAGNSTKQVLAAVDRTLAGAERDLAAITSAEILDKVQKVLEVSPEEISQFMAEPVEMKTEVVYPIKNYGTGVAPFFTNIAMWVAAFILVAILHLTIDPRGLPKFSVTEAYLGRLALFVTLAILQGLVVCVGDLVMGIQCAEPVLYVLAGVVAIFVNVNIMYALVFTLRHIGRAIGVVILIMQIPGASGEYPVQMMPEFYQALHPFLPFTYSIDAMREATGGMYGGQYWLDLLALIPFLALALGFGLIAGRHTFNLNALFDKELSESGLLVTEREGKVVQKYRLRPILEILLRDRGYREAAKKRAQRFQKRYPVLIRIGQAALVGIPVLMVLVGMILPRSADLRLILLLLMVIGVILAGIYLTSVEFLNYRLKNQLIPAEGDSSGNVDMSTLAEGEITGVRRSRRIKKHSGEDVDMSTSRKSKAQQKGGRRRK